MLQLICFLLIEKNDFLFNDQKILKLEKKKDKVKNKHSYNVIYCNKIDNAPKWVFLLEKYCDYYIKIVFILNKINNNMN